MRFLLYHIVKVVIKTGLFFYTKQIKVVGRKNIPRKGAVLFTANHPNGLIDPLIIASSIERKTHFLVRAGVFKNPTIAKLFDLLGMMPVYRIRDGFQQLSKNNAIFENCEQLLYDKKALLIFPEGSHERVRKIRPLSKGFTRIVFGTSAKYPDLKITVIPVGVTYQNASQYPSKVAIHFGKPIDASSFYNTNELNEATKKLKTVVTQQLQNISVHIAKDENYDTLLQKLNNAQVDFTDVKKTNAIISSNEFPTAKKRKTDYLRSLKWVIIINSFIPYFIWKQIEKRIDEIEFIDTFRFGVNLVLFAIFYILQTALVTHFFDVKTGLIYFFTSIFLVGIYSKFSVTNTEDIHT